MNTLGKLPQTPLPQTPQANIPLSHTRQSSAPVTLSQIATLAGVGRPAVSNWRRRFDDFPPAIGSDTGGRDVFSLEAVELWLDHRRRRRRDPAPGVLFQAYDLLRDELDATSTVETTCAALAATRAFERHERSLRRDASSVALLAQIEAAEPSLSGAFSMLQGLPEQTRAALLSLAGSLESETLATNFELALAQLSRFLDSHTSEPLSKLLIRLGFDRSAGAIRTVYDPACGNGGLLMAAIQASDGRLEAFGQEINDRALRIARQRAYVHDLSPRLSRKDSLYDDAYPNLRFDLLVADPPYGIKHEPPAELRASLDPSWTRIGDLIWLLHARSHLSDSGRGYVLLPPSTLVGRRERDARAELLRSGSVEAIVSLPPGLAQRTSIALALWIIRAPRPAPQTGSVLLIDGVPRTEPERSLDGRMVEHIAQTLAAWRDRGVATFDAEQAIAVSIEDLLSAEANLSPARWVGRGPTVHAQQRALILGRAAKDVDAAIDAFSNAGRRPPILHRDAVQVSWVAVGDLLANGHVGLIKGTTIRNGDLCPDGVPLLRVRTLAADGEDLRTDEFVDPGKLGKTPAVTQPQDILVWPSGGRVAARVDQQGGHALASPLLALRIHGDWIDPRLAAAFLEDMTNQRLATAHSTVPRIEASALQLPRLRQDHASELIAALAYLDRADTLARAVAEASRTARAELLAGQRRLAAR